MTAARRVAEYAAGRNRTRVGYGNGTYTTVAYEAGDPRSGYPEMNSHTTPPEVPLPAQAGGAYSYDWVGSMKAAAPSNAWQYNTADQLTLWPGMHSYLYDDNGALTAVKTADGSATQQSFTYHPTGLMDAATFDGQTLTNLWDADEHRVQFSVGEDQYTAVFDVTAGIPAVIKEVNPQGTVYYVREPGGELICRVVTVGETTHKWFYHFDELGSTRLIADDSGAVTDRYSYDAYGAVISHDRNTGTIEQPYQYVGQLGYYTHWQAPEFGWLQLGVRFYEPESGRFERRDPLRSPQASAYALTGATPTSLSDPWGLFPSLPSSGHGDQAAAGQCRTVALAVQCGRQMQREAENEVRRLGLPGMHNGPGDALKHCVGLCKMEVHCPSGTSWLANLHEWTSWFGRYGPVKQEGRMDLHNNAEGRGCGRFVCFGPETISSDSPSSVLRTARGRWEGRSCLACCRQRLRAGKLILLPRQDWD